MVNNIVGWVGVHTEGLHLKTWGIQPLAILNRTGLPLL